MTKLEKAALGVIPLGTDVVEGYYEGRLPWSNWASVKSLCESHERLRAELDGAVLLVAEVENKLERAWEVMAIIARGEVPKLESLLAESLLREQQVAGWKTV